MNKDKKHDIALMRYSVIAPLISGLADDYSSLSDFFRSASVKGVTAPDGSLRHYAPGTIKNWYLSYKKGGFDALIPSGRSDCGCCRKLDDDIIQQINHLKANFPRMSASAIFRQLLDNGTIIKGQISESTVNRYINLLDAQSSKTTSVDMRRYERPHINEVWCGDSSTGLYLKTSDGKKHKLYIIALIDDSSRFITGIDIFFSDNFVNLMSVIKSAVSKYGVPKVFNFDNGSAYKNKQMELLAARIGCSLNYCKPYTPTAKAKIERWFRTLKDQWMASLDMRDFNSIDQLRGSLLSWVNSYNHSPHTSLNGMSPHERFFSEPDKIRRLSQQQIDTNFLLEIERRVSADNVISIDQILYEVDFRFAKQRITIRYSPDMKDIFVVEPDGTLSSLRLLNKQENSIVKREKIHLHRGDI